MGVLILFFFIFKLRKFKYSLVDSVIIVIKS